MKNLSIIHILLFIIMLLAYQCARAQDYVVTLKGDTIKGKIKTFTIGPDKKVTVEGPDRKKSSFSMMQVRSFTENGVLFQTIKKEQTYTFMKVIKTGYLSLYGFQMENQNGYDGLFLRKIDGASMEVPNLTFKKNIKAFLKDCPEVVDSIESGNYGRNDLMTIIDTYNDCIKSKTVKSLETIAPLQNDVGKLTPWNSLEEKVRGKEDFSGKADALEMITEIKGKISRNEKIPNFLIEGLKSSLSATGLTQDLDSAISSLQQ
jgi:hypothetical protein